MRDLDNPFIPSVRDLDNPFIPSVRDLDNPFIPSVRDLDNPFIPSVRDLDNPFIPSVRDLDNPFIPSVRDLDNPFIPSVRDLDNPFIPSVRDLDNPFNPSRLLHPCKLDESISNFRGAWCAMFLVCFLYNIRYTNSVDPDQSQRSGCCCVGVLRPFDTFQVILGAVSKPNHTVPGQAS